MLLALLIMAASIQPAGEEPKIKSTDAIYNHFLEMQKQLKRREMAMKYNPADVVPKVPTWPPNSKHQGPWEAPKQPQPEPPLKDILPSQPKGK